MNSIYGPQYNPTAPAMEPDLQGAPPPSFLNLGPYQPDPTYAYYYPVQPSQPVLTQTVHNKTLELLAKASEQVNPILRRQPATSPSYNPAAVIPAQYLAQPVLKSPQPSINVDLSDRSWKMFNNETHVHHHNDQGAGNQDKQDDTGQRILVGVIGVAAALAAAFFLGKALAGQEDAKEESLNVEELKADWNVNKNLYNRDYSALVDKIVVRLDSILNRQAAGRVHKAALLIFAFIAGGTAFAGALAASKLLMTAAVVIGTCTAAAALFKMGYAYFSKRETKDAETIDRALQELKTVPLT